MTMAQPYPDNQQDNIDLILKDKNAAFIHKINTKSLICGYVRENSSSASAYISSSVLDIILYFYPKMNGYKYIWNISLNSSLSSTLKTFDSDPFCIGLDNKFFLRLRSNSSIKKSGASTTQNNQNRNNNSTWSSWGNNNTNINTTNNNNNNNTDRDDDKNDNDNDNLVLSLISFPLPPKYLYVIIHCELYCHEINEQYSFIWNLSNTTSSIQIGLQTTSFPTGSHSNSHSNNSSIKMTPIHWKIYDEKKILKYLDKGCNCAFECVLNVLNIYPNNYNTNNYRASTDYFKIDKKYNYQCIKYKNHNKMRFIWNFSNKSIINKLFDIKDGIQYHSDVYYDMFQMKIFTKRTKTCFLIQLCGLPKSTTNIAVKWEIFAMDNNKKIKILSQIISFSYNIAIHNLSDDKNKILSDLLYKNMSLILFCKAKIIEKLDINGKIVNDNDNNDDDDGGVKQSHVIIDKDVIKDEENDNDNKDNDSDSDVDNDDDIKNISKDAEIEKEILESKSKIVSSKKDKYIWHITNKQLLYKIKHLPVDTGVNSDVFQLFSGSGNYKWYISIYCMKHRKNTWSSGWGNNNNNSNRNNDHEKAIRIYVNSLCLTKSAIDCRVSIYLLQKDIKYEYYHRYGNGGFAQQSRIPTSSNYLQIKQNKLNKLKEISIRINIEIVNVDIPNNYYGFGGSNRRLNNMKMDDKTEQLNKDVKLWLCNVVKLKEYCDLFNIHGIDDMEVVKLLTIDDIKAMGIIKVGHQIKILSKVKLLNNT